MLNLELLVFRLLRAGEFTEIPIRPEHEVDEVLDFPLIMFHVSGGSALPGTVGKPTAWDASLSLTVFDESIDGAEALAGRLYDFVWSWDNQFGTAHIVPDLGHAAEIVDQSVFSRIATVDVGSSRSVTQYDGRFGLQLHSA